MDLTETRQDQWFGCLEIIILSPKLYRRPCEQGAGRFFGVYQCNSGECVLASLT